jgi:hypothetical protein
MQVNFTQQDSELAVSFELRAARSKKLLAASLWLQDQQPAACSQQPFLIARNSRLKANFTIFEYDSSSVDGF